MASADSLEGPSVQMGGAAALGVAHRARCNASETNALLAAGAGAGIAAAFNTSSTCSSSCPTNDCPATSSAPDVTNTGRASGSAFVPTA